MILTVYYTVNIMVADDLALQGVQAWAAILLTYFSQNIQIVPPEVSIDMFLSFNVYSQNPKYCC